MTDIRPSIEHPLRRALNDEVHARLSDNIETPSSISYLVRVPGRQFEAGDEVELVNDLLSRFGGDPVPAGAKHHSTLLGECQLRWERHTEFNRYTMVAPADPDAPFDEVPVDRIPAEWLARMEGQVLVAANAAIIPYDAHKHELDAVSRKFFAGNMPVGSRLADGNAIALADLRIRDDGYTRLLILNDGMTPAQAGRILQRLLEIQTYRMMTLLSLPLAQKLMPGLDATEHELESVSARLADADSHDEQQLLDRLTKLSAECQHRHLTSSYRFAAADAYYNIVQQRIHDLREERIPGLQTRDEFTARRLKPAVNTYRAVSKRQASLLEQIARATKLLSTRIDIARQQQNQSLLASMNRRASMQLRLQATVEGLSVAAMTYYIVGLIGTVAESLKAAGLAVDKYVAMGVSIPIVASIAYLGIRRLRRRISKVDLDADDAPDL